MKPPAWALRGGADRDLGDYVDEYFALDYEGMAGDLPTRFKSAPSEREHELQGPGRMGLRSARDLERLRNDFKYYG